MNKLSPKDEFYRYWSEKLGLPEDKLRPWFDEEFDGEPDPDAPFLVPDKMEVFHKYSYGGQSRFFREIMKNRRLYGARCPACEKVYCPPRRDCPRCLAATEWVELSGRGHVVNYTVQYYSTSAFVKKVPFLVAYVRLDGTDFLMMANIEMDDVSRARPGMPVEVAFREARHGSITDIYFRPVEEEGN